MALDNSDSRDSRIPNRKAFVGPWAVLDEIFGISPKDSLGKAENGVYQDANQASQYVVQQRSQNVLVIPNIGSKTGSLDSIVDEGTFISTLFTMDRATVKRLQVLLKNANMLGKNYVANGYVDPNGQFTNAMLQVARYTSSTNLSIYNNPSLKGQKPLTLEEGLRRAAKSGAFNQSTTDVSTRANTISIGDSRSILESFYAEAVGRRPTDNEVAKFQNIVNAKAKQNPDVSTTTRDASGNSTTVSKSGFNQNDANVMGRKMAESDPEANAFLTSTKYMDAFMQVIKGKVNQ